MMQSYPEFNAASSNRQRDSAREVEAVLWVAAGAAWAVVALKAWSQARRVDARRRTRLVSDKLLQQVFPHGLRP
jgi:hypothetical protein